MTDSRTTIEHPGIDGATEALTRWRAEEQAATAGPWEYDYKDIRQNWQAGSAPIMELEGFAGWAGCDHTIAIAEADGTLMASARTSVPALLDVVEHVMSDDFARTVVATAHETDPADWLPEDQWLADKVATQIRAAVADTLAPYLSAEGSR